MILNIIHILVNASVLSLPALANLVEHAGSSILTFLVVAGLAAWVSRSNGTVLERSEKIVMTSFAAYFLVCLLFLLGHGLFNERIPLEWDLDHEVRMLAFIPIYYLFLRFGINSGALWYGLSFGAIASGLHAVFYIYVFQSGIRASGAYHPIAFGDISLVLGFMGMAGFRFFRRKNGFWGILPILGLLGGLVATILSATRGAFIAVPVLMIPLMFQMGQYPRSWLIRTSTIVLLVAAVSSSAYLPGSIMSDRIRIAVNAAVSFYQDQDAHPDAVRLKMWAESLEIIKDHPFTGIGKGGYRPAIIEKAAVDPEVKEVVEYGTPHNMFLTNMVDYGGSGLLILLGIFFSPLLILIPAIREPRGPTHDLGYAGVTLIAAFIVYACTETIFFRNIYISIYVILMASILALCRNYRGMTYKDI